MILYCWRSLWIGWDSTQATMNSPGSKRQRFWMAAIRCSLWKWPSPKLNPMIALQANSASRSV